MHDFLNQLIYFNSHPHEEDDEEADEYARKKNISTHILMKRMTFSIAPNIDTIDISTHILMKRMTIPILGICLKDFYFNSHPHEEDDDFSPCIFDLAQYFNSHPHEEDDSNFKQK